MLDYFEDIVIGDMIMFGFYIFIGEVIKVFVCKFDLQLFYLSEEVVV